MSQLKRRPIRIVAVAAAASLLLAACGSSTPTTVVVYVTPAPTPEVTPPPTPEATPTVAVTATPVVTPTASPTPSPTPSPTATSPAASCSGNTANQAFFVEASHKVKATIYCATKLASGWAISAGSWQGTKSGGWMDVTYKYKNTSQTFEIKEGAFCLTSPACAGMPALIQDGVHFDGMTTKLVSDGTPGMYLMNVNPAKWNAYLLTTHNITQAAAVTIGANMKAVPES